MHTSTISYLCYIPSTSMPHACYIHAISMLHPCFIHALSMLYVCYIYAIPMPLPAPVDEVLMSRVRNFALFEDCNQSAELCKQIGVDLESGSCISSQSIPWCEGV